MVSEALGPYGNLAAFAFCPIRSTTLSCLKMEMCQYQHSVSCSIFSGFAESSGQIWGCIWEQYPIALTYFWF